LLYLKVLFLVSYIFFGIASGRKQQKLFVVKMFFFSIAPHDFPDSDDAKDIAANISSLNHPNPFISIIRDSDTHSSADQEVIG